jgi:hypothetical protein
MPHQKSQSGKRMWPSFSRMSLESVNWWSDAANMVLVFSLISGVLATFVLVRTSSRKEWFWEQDRQLAKVKILELEKAAEEAKAETAKAHLALEKIKAPRKLSEDQALRLVEKMLPFAGKKFDLGVSQDAEAQNLAFVIRNILTASHWVAVNWKGGDVVTTWPDKTILGIVMMDGVILQMHPEKASEFWDVATLLAESLTELGIAAKAEKGLGVANNTTDAMHILIGKKPM